MRPKGSAYSFLEDKRFYFWEVSVLDDLFTAKPPGEIVRIEQNSDIVIQTIAGCIRVHNFLFG